MSNPRQGLRCQILLVWPRRFGSEAQELQIRRHLNLRLNQAAVPLSSIGTLKDLGIPVLSEQVTTSSSYENA